MESTWIYFWCGCLFVGLFFNIQNILDVCGAKFRYKLIIYVLYGIIWYWICSRILI
ncbi:Protein of unknown function [Lactobacillus hominis DSM 23910 = CRBIP 24.179]|uniref:Uncharacterized protein n=1 Tax=Lactobacillus hominis DSM 23910 = CRBIP 24.179 TaxID=1423758 RepID=I7KGW1_9LACO|nr:Protein of unknown function [Lactobacillus hominis DSM 23910 = CRBIP 24.179]